MCVTDTAELNKCAMNYIIKYSDFVLISTFIYRTNTKTPANLNF